MLGIWAASRRLGSDSVESGWLILLFGPSWAAFCTGFLRVGAQSALLLGSAAAFVLVLRGLS